MTGAKPIEKYFTFFRFIRPEFYDYSGLLASGMQHDLEEDPRYQSAAGRYFDRCHRAFFLMPYTAPPAASPPNIGTANLYDNYLFLRKYFHPLWSWYILLRQIKNGSGMIRNLNCFFRTFFVKRLPPSEFSPSMPPHEKQEVSVVIPTLGRYESLNILITQLEKQSLPAKEILIVDQTPSTQRMEIPDVPGLKIIYSLNTGQASAKNEGFEHAGSGFLLFLDDDMEIPEHFIAAHASAFSAIPGLAASGGAFSEKRSAFEKNSGKGFFHASHLPGGNCMIRKEILTRYRGFHTAYDHLPLEDTDLYMRLIQNRELIILNKYAFGFHKKIRKGGMRFRLMQYQDHLNASINEQTIRFWSKNLDSSYLKELIIHEGLRCFKTYIHQLPRWRKPFSILVLIWITLFYLFKVHRKSLKFSLSG